MVEAQFGGDYLSIDTAKDGDIAVIIDKPKLGKMTYQGVEKQVTNILVDCAGKKLTYTPTNKAGKVLVKAWGREMDNWVGKKFQVFIMEDKLITRPITEQKA